MKQSKLGVLLALAALVAVMDGSGCSGGTSKFKTTSGGVGGSTSGDTGAGADSGTSLSSTSSAGGTDLLTTGGGSCVGLECAVPKNCGNKDGTSISGTVFAPSGQLPLYNVVVYIPKFPDKPLEPITSGAKCEPCASKIDNVISTALSDSKGKFKLTNVPAGTNIPLVVQVGKWRRKVVLPNVSPCKDNVLTNPEQTRLPRSQKEGDIPQMAIATGGCDPLACLFRKMGLADSEFTDHNGKGKMHVFKGYSGQMVDGGNAAPAEQTLWATKGNLMKYDVVLLSCECNEHNELKSDAQKQYMKEYLDSGGRAFGTHYHYTWFKNGPQEFKDIASWPGVYAQSPFTIETSFPKGKAFAEWLNFVGAAQGDQIDLQGPAADVADVSLNARRWIYKPAPQLTTKYFTFNTPIGIAPEKQCGRGVLSDIHVSSGGATGGSIPSACKMADLTAQEKALVFLFFDLAACITPDDKPPEPPLPN